MEDLQPEVEKAVVSCSVRMNGALQRKLNKKLYDGMLGVGLVFTVLGAASCIAYLALSVFNVYYPDTVSGNFGALLWAGGIVLAIGFALLVMVTKARRNAKNMAERINEYAFYDGYFTVRTVDAEGVELGVAKQGYADCEQVIEKRDFILIYLENGSYFPVDKTLLSGEELELLRGLLPEKK